MDDDGKFALIAAAVFGVVILVLAFLSGMGAQRKIIEQSSVKEGRAHWIAKEDGSAQFEWCHCECK